VNSSLDVSLLCRAWHNKQASHASVAQQAFFRLLQREDLEYNLELPPVVGRLLVVAPAPPRELRLELVQLVHVASDIAFQVSDQLPFGIFPSM
jgi:hypothetical protein